MTDVHPDDEALSAHLDGEEPRLRDHIAGCSSCSLRLDQLSRVRAALATSVPTPPSWQRDAAIAIALQAAAGESAEPWHRGFATRAASVAAALLLVVGAAFAIAQFSESSENDESTAAGGTAGARTSEASTASPPPNAVGDLGDLGALADSAALRQRVEPKAAEFALARERTQNQESARSSPAAPATATDAQDGVDQQRTVRLACADATRALDPTNVGPTYAGTATWQGTPARVLVYSVGQQGGVHVYVVAQGDCRVLEFQSYAP